MRVSFAYRCRAHAQHLTVDLLDASPRRPLLASEAEPLVFRGFGDYVHAVSLERRDVMTVALGSYFGHLYPTADYLLLASGERLFRMEPDRSIRWRSDVLGIDGVVVGEAGPPLIRGDVAENGAPAER